MNEDVGLGKITRWFETLTGFAEESPEQVRANITVEGVELTSLVNGKRMICGELETPTLAELRRRIQSSAHSSSTTRVREVVANVQLVQSLLVPGRFTATTLHLSTARPDNPQQIKSIASPISALRWGTPIVSFGK